MPREKKTQARVPGMPTLLGEKKEEKEPPREGEGRPAVGGGKARGRHSKRCQMLLRGQLNTEGPRRVY